MSNRSTKSTLENLYSYDDILLRDYFDIAQSRDFNKLIKYGRATKDQLEEQWENIVKRNNEEAGVFDYSNYREALEAYHYLLSVYHKVKTCLFKLSIRCDYKVIDMLALEGYVISKEVDKYDNSLYLASRKSDNLVTKIKSKLHEINLYRDNGDKPLTFESALAKASFGAKYDVSRNITLCGYNQLMKEIKSHGSRNRQA